MIEFTLKLKLDEDLDISDRTIDIARSLTGAAYDVLCNSAEGKCYDSDGTSIGEWAMKEDGVEVAPTAETHKFKVGDKVRVAMDLASLASVRKGDFGIIMDCRINKLYDVRMESNLHHEWTLHEDYLELATHSAV